MPRVTAQTVKEIVTTKLTDAVINSNHIVTANLMVTTHLSDQGHTAAILTQIELYLAAHFVTLTEEGGGITRSKIGDADESYANVYDQGFSSTRFGQTALSLDTSGTLARVAQSKLKADFRVV